MEFGLGYSEIALIMVIALIVFGPRRLPELMRTVGKLMGQLRRASDDLRREVLFSDEMSSLKDAINPLSPPPVPPPLRVKSEEAAGALPSSVPESPAAGAAVIPSSPATAPEAPPLGDKPDGQ